jgi:transcriptional regulator with XRE-family HTH domain
MRERTIKIDPDKLVTARGEWRRQADVARKLADIGLTRQKLWNYENGIHDVPESTLKALCALYGVSVKSVLADDVQPSEQTKAVA